MPFWDKIDEDCYLTLHQEALRKRPSVPDLIKDCPATLIFSTKILFPFTMTLDYYAGFKALSISYLEKEDSGVPVDTYTLGVTVLMWHKAIWEYIGQTINMYCDWVESEERVSFASATKPELFQNLEQDRLDPIPKDKVEQLALTLRSIHGSINSPLKIRNIGSHKYHIANTYSTEFAELINMKTNGSHLNRLSQFQKQVTKSFEGLIKAQHELIGFIDDHWVEEWNPDWFQK